jgi:4-amino-4-deoxy-L-arabinose transferase-like glycosyltransferase
MIVSCFRICGWNRLDALILRIMDVDRKRRAGCPLSQKPRFLNAAVVILVLATSLGLRAVGLDAFIVDDEIRWTCRSISFRDALARGDWAGTFRTGHPGVVTTWLGTIFIPHAEGQAKTMCQASEDAAEFGQVDLTSAEKTQAMALLGHMLFKGRWGPVLFTWVCVIAIYLLVRLLWGARVAMLSLVLVALDPFFLALSRFLHLDAVLTGLMVISVLSVLVSLERSRSTASHWVFLMLSGGAGGLAILQKSPAGFLVPFVALLLVIDVFRHGMSGRMFLLATRDLVVWCLTAGIVCVALWPAMWVDLLGTVKRVWGKAVDYAEEGHNFGSYFLGQPVHDPGWGYYPMAAAFRLSPLVLVGLVIGLGWLIWGRERVRGRFGLIALMLYSVLFGAFMSLGAKKFDRYLLPVFPALEIMVAVGLGWAAEAGLAYLKGRGGNACSFAWSLICLIVFVIQGVLILPHHPYYLTYYNPLLGGPRQAQQVLLVGWGEGYDLVAAYLNGKPDARELRVAMPSYAVFAPQFDGEAQPIPQYEVWDSDYVLLYISHVQRQRYSEVMEDYLLNPERQPEYVVSLHDVDYAWLYRNDHYVAPMQYIEEHSVPEEGECLVVDGDSLFAKHYEGNLPIYQVYARPDPEREGRTYWRVEDLAALLDGLPSTCRRVWYARYPASEGGTYGDLLDSRGVLLDKASFPHMEVTLHRLVGPDLVYRPMDARFGDLVLRSYSLTEPVPAWGQDGGVVLEWEAIQPLEEDYTVFLHLYDSHGRRIAQTDSLITDGYLRPTSRWKPGAAGSALYHLSIPPATPPGKYELEVGVYLLETGERLRLVDSSGAPRSTSVRLEVEIGSSDHSPALADLNLSYSVARDLMPQLGLLGYELEREALLAGQDVSLRLAWQALEAMSQDYRLQLKLQDADGTIYGEGIFDLVTTDYPTSQWRPGEVLQEWYTLPAGEGTATGEASLMLGLLDEKGDAVSQTVKVARVWIQSTRPSFEIPTDISTRCEVDLDDKISLLGYDLDSGPVRPGESIHVTLYWQARQAMEESCKVFVHVYDVEGNLVAQRDWLPGLGVKPTTTWKAGEVVADRHIVPLDEGVRAGKYRVAVGMYKEANGERLAAYEGRDERLDEDRIFLGEVEVEP